MDIMAIPIIVSKSQTSLKYWRFFSCRAVVWGWWDSPKVLTCSGRRSFIQHQACWRGHKLQSRDIWFRRHEGHVRALQSDYTRDWNLTLLLHVKFWIAVHATSGDSLKSGGGWSVSFWVWSRRKQKTIKFEVKLIPILCRWAVGTYTCFAAVCKSRHGSVAEKVIQFWRITSKCEGSLAHLSYRGYGEVPISVPWSLNAICHISLISVEQNVVLGDDTIFDLTCALHLEQKAVVWMKDVFRKFPSPRQTIVERRPGPLL